MDVLGEKASLRRPSVPHREPWQSFITRRGTGFLRPGPMAFSCRSFHLIFLGPAHTLKSCSTIATQSSDYMPGSAPGCWESIRVFPRSTGLPGESLFRPLPISLCPGRQIHTRALAHLVRANPATPPAGSPYVEACLSARGAGRARLELNRLAEEGFKMNGGTAAKPGSIPFEGGNLN